MLGGHPPNPPRIETVKSQSGPETVDFPFRARRSSECFHQTVDLWGESPQTPRINVGKYKVSRPVCFSGEPGVARCSWD